MENPFEHSFEVSMGIFMITILLVWFSSALLLVLLRMKRRDLFDKQFDIFDIVLPFGSRDFPVIKFIGRTKGDEIPGPFYKGLRAFIFVSYYTAICAFFVGILSLVFRGGV